MEPHGSWDEFSMQMTDSGEKQHRQTFEEWCEQVAYLIEMDAARLEDLSWKLQYYDRRTPYRAAEYFIENMYNGGTQQLLMTRMKDRYIARQREATATKPQSSAGVCFQLVSDTDGAIPSSIFGPFPRLTLRDKRLLLDSRVLAFQYADGEPVWRFPTDVAVREYLRRHLMLKGSQCGNVEFNSSYTDVEFSTAPPPAE